jgi:hypothetical protein
MYTGFCGAGMWTGAGCTGTLTGGGAGQCHGGDHGKCPGDDPSGGEPGRFRGRGFIGAGGTM